MLPALQSLQNKLNTLLTGRLVCTFNLKLSNVFINYYLRTSVQLPSYGPRWRWIKIGSGNDDLTKCTNRYAELDIRIYIYLMNSVICQRRHYPYQQNHNAFRYSDVNWNFSSCNFCTWRSWWSNLRIGVFLLHVCIFGFITKHHLALLSFQWKLLFPQLLTVYPT